MYVRPHFRRTVTGEPTRETRKGLGFTIKADWGDEKTHKGEKERVKEG